jgi:hypothetical protein
VSGQTNSNAVPPPVIVAGTHRLRSVRNVKSTDAVGAGCWAAAGGVLAEVTSARTVARRTTRRGIDNSGVKRRADRGPGGILHDGQSGEDGADACRMEAQLGGGRQAEPHRPPVRSYSGVRLRLCYSTATGSPISLRSFASISAAMTGFCLRNALAFSRPWPSRSPP